MSKSYILLSAVIMSGFIYGDCSEQCSKYSMPESKYQLGNYCMNVTLCMDGVSLCSKKIGEDDITSNCVLFDEQGVAVTLKEVNAEGAIVQICVLNENCPMSKSRPNSCDVVCDKANSCKDACLKQVCWDQEVVIECSDCQYSLLISLDK